MADQYPFCPVADSEAWVDENRKMLYSIIMGKKTCSFLTIMGVRPLGAGSEKLGKMLGLTCLLCLGKFGSILYRSGVGGSLSTRDGIRHYAC